MSKKGYETLKIGDWVTQFYKGYWQIVDIKPRLASDYEHYGQDRFKKGDVIGEWVLLKKAFTQTMKFKLNSGSSDPHWCKPVSPEILEQIHRYFDDHPDDYKKFCETPFVENMPLDHVWPVGLISDKEINEFVSALKELPDRFTKAQMEQFLRAKGVTKYIYRMPMNYLFRVIHVGWELNEDFDALYKNPALIERFFEDKNGKTIFKKES